jgi:uncharacterized Tic20 family protein
LLGVGRLIDGDGGNLLGRPLRPPQWRVRMSGSATHHESSDVTGPPPPPPASAPEPRPGDAPVTAEVRGWGAAAHLSALVGAWVALAFVGPLVVYLVGRDRHPFVAHHAREALNFNLTFLLVIVVGAVVGLLGAVVTLGLGLVVIVPIAAAVALGWLILLVVATVKAWDGEGYRYPLTIRFVR